MDILNSEITIESSYVLVPIPIIGIIILALYLLKNRKNDTKDSQKDQISNKKLDSNSQSHTTNLHHHQQQQNSQNSKTTKSSKTRHNKRGTTNSNTTSSNDSKASSHPWLASNLKGHTDDIHDIDFSNNGKFLASCSEDRTVLIWSTNQLEDAKDRKWFRLNIQYDYGIKLAWSPDSKAIAILKAAENCIEVYKLDRKDGWFSSYERCLTFPKVTDDEIVGFGISCTGRYIITCTNNTDLYIWNLKGSILEKIDTYLMNTYSAKISPCGRFVAACGFAPDCKIWEVKFSRNGEYQKTVRAFDLTGHTSGIYDCAFDQDSSHIATVSKDSSWKLFDIKIEFDKGQLPRCLKTGKYTIGSTDPISALSLNAEVLAIASGNQIQLFSMFTGELDMTIKNVYEGPIAEIMFDPLGKYLLTAGDRHIRVYHNITGMKTSSLIAEEKLKRGSVTRATKERLEQQIKDNQNFIKKFQ